MLIHSKRQYHKLIVDRIGRLEQIAVAMNRSAIWTDDQDRAEVDNLNADIAMIERV